MSTVIRILAFSCSKTKDLLISMIASFKLVYLCVYNFDRKTE